eukprot:13526008-Alexandrium_andersonii.AAC.1
MRFDSAVLPARRHAGTGSRAWQSTATSRNSTSALARTPSRSPPKWLASASSPLAKRPATRSPSRSSAGKVSSHHLGHA